MCVVARKASGGGTAGEAAGYAARAGKAGAIVTGNGSYAGAPGCKFNLKNTARKHNKSAAIHLKMMHGAKATGNNGSSAHERRYIVAENVLCVSDVGLFLNGNAKEERCWSKGEDDGKRSKLEPRTRTRPCDDCNSEN